jgi:hypothetical protein
MDREQIRVTRALKEIVGAMTERGRKVSDCENVKTTYVDGRPKFRYCGRCPMCRVWKVLDGLEATDA